MLKRAVLAAVMGVGAAGPVLAGGDVPLNGLEICHDHGPSWVAEHWLAAGGLKTRPYVSNQLMFEWEPGEWNGVGHPVARIAACYAPGTDEAYMMEIEARLGRGWGERYFVTNPWSGSTGVALNLSWSLVPDGVFIPSGVGEPGANSQLFSRLDSLFATQGGRATWVSRIQMVFDRWQTLTGVTYTRVRVGGNDWDDGASWGSNGSANLRGDVRIAMKPIDGQWNILAYNNLGPPGDMVLDSAEAWGSPSNQHDFLRNTVSHEHGHGLGLLHVCPMNNTKLMEPALSLSFDGPQQDDIRGVQYLYGDAFENNNFGSQARHVGVLPAPGNIIVGQVPAPAALFSSLCSIATETDYDWYGFTVESNRLVNISVQPIGSNYDSSPQCSSGNFINALAVKNLDVQAYASNRSTLLGQANSAGLGQTENLNGVLMSPPGDFYARVYTSTPGGDQSQMYRLTITSSTVTQITASDGTFDNFVRVVWTTIPNVAGYRVFRGTTTNFGTAVQIASLGFDGSTPPTTYDDATAAPGTTYYYWAYAGFLVTPPSTYRYQVIAGPDAGFRNNNATCPTISSHPSPLTRCTGQSASFVVGATGNPAPTYQWQKNGQNISNGGNISGATTNTLVINPVGVGDFGDYRCVATNSCGSATSNAATLTVHVAPSITQHPVGGTFRVGDNVQLSVTASGTPSPTYQWRKNGGNIGGATNPTYTITSATQNDSGNYDVVVTNSCGSTTSNVAVVVISCPADFNGDGQVDFFDYLDFVQAFNDEDPSADFNGDGQVDFFDYLDFAQAFNEGC